MRCEIKKIISFFLTVFLLLSFPAAQAGTKTFTEEYTYRADRLGNRTSARALALEGVKERLWQNFWTYLDGLTEESSAYGRTDTGFRPDSGAHPGHR
jgi:hypothetical protein